MPNTFERLKMEQKAVPTTKPQIIEVSEPETILGKAAEFLIPSTAKTVGKIRKGEGVGIRDVAGSALELGSFVVPAGAIARGGLMGLRALGLAKKAATAAKFATPVLQKAAPTLLKRTAQRAGEAAFAGGLYGAGQATARGEDIGGIAGEALKTGAMAAPFGVAIPAAGALIGRTAKGIGRVVAEGGAKQTASRIQQGVVRISKGKQEAFRQLSKGEGVGDYLVNRGIFGNMEDTVSQLFKRFNQSRSAVDGAFEKLPGTHKFTPIKTALKQLFSREKSISTPGAPSKDLARVKELSAAYDKKGLTMSEVNEAKRLFERNVRLDYVKQNLPVKVAQSNTIDNAIRIWQQTQANKLGFKNVQQLNKETQLAKRLMDDIGKEHTGLAGNNMITLTDWIILAKGDPTAIASFIAKKALLSQKARAEFAKLIAPKPIIGIPRAIIQSPSPARPQPVGL